MNSQTQIDLVCTNNSHQIDWHKYIDFQLILLNWDTLLHKLTQSNRLHTIYNSHYLWGWIVQQVSLQRQFIKCLHISMVMVTNCFALEHCRL